MVDLPQCVDVEPVEEPKKEMDSVSNWGRQNVSLLNTIASVLQVVHHVR